MELKIRIKVELGTRIEFISNFIIFWIRIKFNFCFIVLRDFYCVSYLTNMHHAQSPTFNTRPISIS